MVELETINMLVQIVGVSAAAIATVVGVRSYIVSNKRAQETRDRELETRRISLIDSMASRLQTPEAMKIYQEIMNYEWRDYEDYVRKYGSAYNMEAAAKRLGTWNVYNSVGAMLRKGIVEPEDVYDLGAHGIVQLWVKYRSIIEESRRRINGQDWLRDLEYLAGEMTKVKLKRDPSYKVPETFGIRLPDK
jgi:isopentenyl diphosphate isomerase/L-lactate dehydrogenase-like FMN-dependent dehydrogenase